VIERSQKKGFTLIEILVASSIFVIVITLTTVILFDIIKVEKISDILNAVYDDSRVVMGQLATLIHDNAIDYDEYYSVNFIQPVAPLTPIAYGMYHGVYSSRFYDPGRTYVNEPNVGEPGTNPQNLGIECTTTNPDGSPTPVSQCRFPIKLSKDKNTGINPYDGSGGADADANSICDSTGSCTDIVDETSPVYSELYLINAAGNKKTIIGRQFIKENPEATEPDDYTLAMLELDGIDSDQNGIMDLFTCSQNYKCDTDKTNIKLYLIDPFDTNWPPAMMDNSVDQPGANENNITDLGLSIATRKDLINPLTSLANSRFIPITPFRSTVVSVKFIINPIEDPYKGYAETAIQSHPSVTILLTMQPSAAEMALYPGDPPLPVTIQRTVTAGVHQKVESYPPTNELGWLEALVPETGN
jgi:prepilin-type N-terminal cleavage/methylation domain-containing protein